MAEILPLESADMYYTPPLIKGHTDYIPHLKRKLPIDWDIEQKTPCWSLAALLDTIPQEIFDGEYIINITEGSDNRWIITYDHYENRNHSYYGLSSSADNLVDACVKIITRLHELKIL